MIMIIQGYVILMKYSFVVSLFYVEQQQTMSHKIVYLCQRYTKLTKN